MITRQLALRHGRIALSRPLPSWQRANLATAVEQHTSSLPRADPTSLDLPTPQPSQLAQRLPSSKNSDRDVKYAIFARDYHESQEYRSKTRSLGARITPQYQPSALISNPPSPEDITLEALMAAQSHFGHATGLWHPANSRYIYGIRSGIHIISLDQTASHLRRAAKIVRSTTAQGGLVLFVGTRDGQMQSVVKAAELSGGCHLFDRWIPGSITNAHQILANCRLIVKDADDETVPDFEDQLGKHPALKPDLVVVLNPLENYVLLRECRQHNIPTIGVVDTDCNPTWVTYPIPANDDSRRCTNFIAGVLGRAGEQGKERRLEFVRLHNTVPYEQGHQLIDNEAAGGGDGAGREAALELLQKQEARDVQRSRLATAASTDALLGPADYLAEAQLDAASNIAELSDFYDNGLEILAADMINDVPVDREITEAELKEAETALAEAGLLSEEDDRFNLVTAAHESLDPAQGQQIENLAAEYLNEQISDDEASELIRLASEKRMQGLAVDMPSVQDSTMEAMLKLREAEDPALARLVAVKRRALGESLSEADMKILETVEKEEEQHRTFVGQEAAQAIKVIEARQAVADEVASNLVAGEAEEADGQGRRKMAERERSRNAHREDDQVDIGPIRKNRKGRPQ
ncbi:37S ribosomal protein MRP4, mitochondrial [Sphaceloma murrayae]|uniref:37S ribosomal protein MRP4, mitochondrial n=1 Tax=Sphaceloma murrayae TaxID=2082308 RepID=A0A2K1R3S3_9PEZI|nr:37S ribosomal protein MRP4, mitochondrial [Sphaceloma murrayae]